MRRLLKLVVAGLAALYLATGAYHAFKPLPEGISVATPWRDAGEVRFLADTSWVDAEGNAQSEQEIFDEVLRIVEDSQTTVVADFFLVNRFAGEAGGGQRPLSGELVTAMIERRRIRAGLRAMLITDPFNTLYGGVPQPLFEELEAAGVAVVSTRLGALRDPNPSWSAAWRICCQWFGNSPGGWLANPVGGQDVSLRTYLALLNFKANHRKTLVADTTDGWTGLVTSGNPHDASSRHHNIAISFTGSAALDLLATEQAVVAFSGGEPLGVPVSEAGAPAAATQIRVLTESRILDAVIEMLGDAGPGDRVDLLMFYLSHRDIVRGLIDAHERGANVRVLLDPNRDAFGREKNGIPNRQVALELHRAGIPVRWCNTRGEQCHGKMLIVRGANGQGQLLAGSANFTRRNLDDLNLETDVQVRGPLETPAIADAMGFFEVRFQNEAGRVYSLEYAAFADDSRLRYWMYRFMEWSGWSAF